MFRRIATEKNYAAPGARVLANVVGVLAGGPDKPTRPAEPHLLAHYLLFQVCFNLACHQQAEDVPMKLRMRHDQQMALLDGQLLTTFALGNLGFRLKNFPQSIRSAIPPFGMLHFF